jgi:hypothetical protein
MAYQRGRNSGDHVLARSVAISPSAQVTGTSPEIATIL